MTAILSGKNKEAKTKKVSKEKKKSSKKQKESVAIVGKVGRELASRVLRRPHVTEKSHGLAQSGIYVFEVARDATKITIRQAVQQVYGVEVVSVRTINQKGVKKRFGKSMGKTKDQKKAMVQLKEGQSIEIFEGA